MRSFSPIHWIILLVVGLLWVWPAVRLLRRLGLPPAFALLAAVPIVNLIAVWVLAFVSWPALKEPGVHA